MKQAILKIALLLLAGTHLAAAQISSTFESTSGNFASAEGWTTSFFPLSGPFTTPTSTGTAALSSGPDGHKLDIAYGGFGEDPLLYFEAPVKFLGNDSFAYRGTLSFDVGDGGSSPLNGPDVILVGNNLTLVLDIATNPPTDPKYLVLGHFEVSLMPSSSWHLSTLTGATPTAAQFQSVLSSLTALRIRGSFHDRGVAGIDNITMVPEPSTVALLVVALAFGGMSIYRSNRRGRPLASQSADW